MQFFKNFFSVALLTFVIALFSTPQAHAQTGAGGSTIQMHADPLAAAYIKFDGVDGECTVREGRNVVGKNTRTGDQLIIVVRNGKLAAFGLQPTSGAFKAIPPSASPCFTITCGTFNPPKCFPMPNGGCVCVCGPWITSNTPGGN